MSRDRLRRFRHLERARRPGVEPDPPAADERFERIDASRKAPAEIPIPEEMTDRFRLPRERPLEVAETADGVQPFRRCARCEMDSARLAEVCSNCGADLRTQEQEAFNQRLWAKRRQEAAEEDRVLAESQRERARLETEERRQRRELAAELARREAERVEGELGEAWGGGGGYGERPGRHGPGAAPLGIRLLRRVKSPALRIAVIVVAVALPLTLVIVGRRGSGVQMAGMILFALLLAMVSPSRYGWRRRGFWRW